MKREYLIKFEGRMTVCATSDDEAWELAGDQLDHLDYTITDIEEGEKPVKEHDI